MSVLWSVLIPAYKEYNSIAKAITHVRTVAKQDNVPVQIIVASADTKTTTAAKRADKAFTHTANGRGGALKQALVYAKGTHIMMFHADCVLPDNAFSLAQRTLNQPRTAGCCFTTKYAVRGFSPWWTHWFSRFRVRVGNIMFGDQCICVKKPLIDKVGITDQPLLEDVELSLRLKKHGYIRLINAPVYASERRFAQNGWLRQGLKNQSIVLRYRFGVSAHKLARQYDNKPRSA